MLKKINNGFYTYIDAKTGIVFCLKAGRIGQWSLGKCWRLSFVSHGLDTIMACFVTEDDSHNCFKDCCEKRIWNETEILPAANEMIKRMLA